MTNWRLYTALRPLGVLWKGLKLICIAAFLISSWSCNRNNPNNRYDRLSNNNQGWQDITDQVNGSPDQKGNLRRYYFLRTGEFSISCEASDPSCVTLGNTSGTWSYITDTRVEVQIYNGPILFYDIIKIDPNNLWLQENTKNQRVLRKMVPAR